MLYIFLYILSVVISIYIFKLSNILFYKFGEGNIIGGAPGIIVSMIPFLNILTSVVFLFVVSVSRLVRYIGTKQIIKKYWQKMCNFILVKE